MLEIEKFADNARFEHTGDVHVRRTVGENTNIVITNGSLFIDGNVGPNSQITIIASSAPTEMVSGRRFVSLASVATVSASRVHVKGSLECNVCISTGSTDVIIDGVVGANSKLSTKSGEISASEIKETVHLSTKSGNIRVGNVGANSTLNTVSGHISVRNRHASASLQTMSGDIYENSVKRRNESAFSTNVAGMAATPPGDRGPVYFGRRAYVNGRDITDAVSSSSAMVSVPPCAHQIPVVPCVPVVPIADEALESAKTDIWNASKTRNDKFNQKSSLFNVGLDAYKRDYINAVIGIIRNSFPYETQTRERNELFLYAAQTPLARIGSSAKSQTSITLEVLARKEITVQPFGAPPIMYRGQAVGPRRN